jgi:hypothetical protein
MYQDIVAGSSKKKLKTMYQHREVSQPKFIDDFFCKALMAVHKNQVA